MPVFVVEQLEVVNVKHNKRNVVRLGVLSRMIAFGAFYLLKEMGVKVTATEDLRHLIIY